MILVPETQERVQTRVFLDPKVLEMLQTYIQPELILFLNSRHKSAINKLLFKVFYLLVQVNLKTPDATVETEEQYRTKVCIKGRPKVVTKIKTILQPRWRSGSRYQRS